MTSELQIKYLPVMENPELDNVIAQLGLQKEDYLFLTIRTVYLYHIKSGEKNSGIP